MQLREEKWVGRLHLEVGVPENGLPHAIHWFIDDGFIPFYMAIWGAAHSQTHLIDEHGHLLAFKSSN